MPSIDKVYPGLVSLIPILPLTIRLFVIVAESDIVSQSEIEALVNEKLPPPVRLPPVMVRTLSVNVVAHKLVNPAEDISVSAEPEALLKLNRLRPVISWEFPVIAPVSVNAATLAKSVVPEIVKAP